MHLYYKEIKIGIDGKPVEKTRATNPYNYDTFIMWGDLNAETNCGVYSDRLMQMDFKKHDECLMKVFGDKGQLWSYREPKKIEKFLQLFFDDDSIQLKKIYEGCNSSNGYPYWFFGYMKNT